jgi:hypothetical protein
MTNLLIFVFNNILDKWLFKDFIKKKVTIHDGIKDK